MVKIIIPLLCKVNNNEYIYHKGMTKKKLKRNDDGEKLRMYLLNLPVKESSEMSLKLAEACKVPLHTIRNWRGSRCRGSNGHENLPCGLNNLLRLKCYEYKDYCESEQCRYLIYG